FDLNSSAGYSRNADQRIDYQSFYSRKFFGSFLFWNEYDTDRLYFEIVPSINIKFTHLKFGVAFPFTYDDEKWYMSMEETTPEYPTGTGRTLDVLSSVKFYQFRAFISYATLNGITFDGYIETGLKKVRTTDFEKADKKSTKLDISYDGNTTEYTDYPFIYGVKAYFDEDISEKSVLSAEIMFETFEDDDNNYNNLFAINFGYYHSLFASFKIRLDAGIEYYTFEYEGIEFPDNADPEDLELITTDGDDSFTLISLGTSLSYFPVNELEIFLKADFGTYQNAAYLPDKLKLGLGAQYTLDFAR
ncbi:MAG: hypothetical protein L6407_09685, partial [Candidatus Delongbacteria bacterium]|nr:hypothetical protein [Candidatus Delongbacteria bacterium]